MRYKILFVVVSAFAVLACTQKDLINAGFTSDRDIIEVGANGGVEKVRISSADEWIASVELNAPWIAISPANGRGSVVCDFIIDSALVTKERSAKVTIRNLVTNAEQKITVKQSGFDYSVSVDNANVKVKRLADFDKRYFDVVVRSNFDFKVDIPEDDRHWLSYESYKLDLNRGVRPREVKVRFNWKINNSAEERLADIKFIPKSTDVVVEDENSETLSVVQEAGDNIEDVKDTRAGDSLALLNIASTLQSWTVWDSSTPMDTWNGVTLWGEYDGCPAKDVGRVRKLEIFLCSAYDGLPYETKYLTAADEIYIFSNENSMLKEIKLFENFTEKDPLILDNLKRLTVAAFGVSKFEINKNVSLPNLEFLDIGSNNFQRVPEDINPENFPRLHALVLNAQQRHAVSDLSNAVYPVAELGGLIEEEKFPERLLLWKSAEGKCLDTLVLSVNYLHGELPSFEGRADVPTWTEAEVIAADTLPRELIGVPKILPTTKTFRINHNRLSGEAPKWLMMHPALDWWVPFSLIFPQEGRYTDGTKAGFTNEPPSLIEYYTKWYPNKKLADTINEEIPEDDSEIITK